MTNSRLVSCSVLRHASAIFFLGLFLSATARPAGSSQPAVRVIASGPSSITIEYVPDVRKIGGVRINGASYSQYTISDRSYGGPARPGSPELLEKVLTVRLPGSAGNTIELLQTSYEDEGGARLAPVPSGSLIESRAAVASAYRIDPASYAHQGFIPEQVVALRNVGSARSAFLGTLAFHPLQYNPAAGTIRRYTRIVCRVNFGPSEAGPSDADRLGESVAINDDQFASTVSPRQTKSAAAIVNSVLASGEWFRFPVSEDGIYKLTGQQLLALGIPASTPPNTIKIFSNGGLELPTDPTAPSPDDLLQNAVYVSDEENPGHLDANDFILFFAKRARGWVYRPGTRSFAHYINHFTDVSFYWLTYGGAPTLTMTSVPSSNDPSAVHPSTVLGKVFREEEKINILNSGMDWLGQSLGPSESVNYDVPLPGIDQSQPVNYLIRVGGRSPESSSMVITEHGEQIAAPVFYGINIGEYEYQISLQTPSITRPAPAGSVAQLRLVYKSNNSAGTGYLDWYEVTYRRLLQAQNDQFQFHTADTTAAMEYAVSNLSGAAMVFDVTQFDKASLVTGGSFASGTQKFQVGLESGVVKELYVVGPSGFKTPAGFARVANQNLHGDTVAADNIIITHPDFLPAAQRLKAHRESTVGGGLRTTVVDVTQIYNEFGGGVASPAAIRNYLRYRFFNASHPPQFVLLFGDGDFDYKRIIASGPNWIPAWETAESFDPLSSYPSDDDYAIFSSGSRVNLGVGRLTSRSLDEANAMVGKIIAYESAPSSDPWILRTTFVADDGPAAAGVNELFAHTDDAENAAALIPPLFNMSKIYEYMYPTIYTSAGRRKPAVNQAIVDQINAGTLLMNFNGHGNPRLWTHEAIFVRETDFPRLHNTGKYFFLVAATCNYAEYDVLDQQSGGEMLVAMPDAGAIAVFSATRPVYEAQNAALNQTVYRNLFQFGPDGRLLPMRLGTMVYRTKQQHIDENDRKYFLLGDPAMRIAFPQLTASVDSINHAAPVTPVPLSALSTVSMKARVLDSAGVPPFSGTALVEVYDAPKKVGVQDLYDNGDGTTITRVDSFFVAGDVLFRGQASVDAGRTSASFVVPKDISYNNGNGKINLYLWNPTMDGAGYTSNIRIGGTDSTAAPDAQGPAIQLYVGSRSFHSGDVVGADPTLLVDLQDEHGINTSGAGVGHRLEAWLDGATESIDLSGFYRSEKDNYQRGTISYPMTGLPVGSHTVKLRAWDTYNNSSIAEAAFDVMTGAGLQMNNVMNYPNPCNGPTIFTFEQSQPGSVRVSIRIYTVAGRLIQSLEPGVITSTDRLVRVPWDGRDREGSALANGIYLYKIIATSINSKSSAEAYGKLSVLR